MAVCVGSIEQNVGHLQDSARSVPMPSPLAIATAFELIARFFQQQGLSHLAQSCRAEICCEVAMQTRAVALATEVTAESAPLAASSSSCPSGSRDEVLHLGCSLVNLASPSARPGCLVSGCDDAERCIGDRFEDVEYNRQRNAERRLEHGCCRRHKLTLSHESLSFLWPLLPQFIEKPTTVFALTKLAKVPHQALRDDHKRLCIGHVHLHPNSLGALTSKFGRSGILDRVSFRSLVSAQFHLPRLLEAFWLLEMLARNPCHSLRKLVDRQSRWRSRELHFDALNEADISRAADVADELANLRSLRHLEGPVFSVIFRARGQRSVAQSEEGSGSLSSLKPHAWLQEPGALQCGGDNNPAGADWNATPSTFNATDSSSHTCTGRFADKLEVVHLIDTHKDALLGLWEPSYCKLRKLVLLNLPSTSPGHTAASIAAFLPKVPSLTELQLDFQYFEPSNWELDALEVLVERVQRCPSKVAKLTFEWCRFGDAGVQRVCQTFGRNPRGAVQELSLAHCEMRDISCVCEMLKIPGLSLTKLDLSSNTLDDSRAARLAEALPLSNLKELKLRDSQVSIPLPVKTEWFDTFLSR